MKSKQQLKNTMLNPILKYLIWNGWLVGIHGSVLLNQQYYLRRFSHNLNVASATHINYWFFPSISIALSFYLLYCLSNEFSSNKFSYIRLDNQKFSADVTNCNFQCKHFVYHARTTVSKNGYWNQIPKSRFQRR